MIWKLGVESPNSRLGDLPGELKGRGGLCVRMAQQGYIS